MQLPTIQPGNTHPFNRATTPRFGLAVHVQGNDFSQVHREVNRYLTNREPASFFTMTEWHEVRNGDEVTKDAHGLYLDQDHLSGFLPITPHATVPVLPQMPNIVQPQSDNTERRKIQVKTQPAEPRYVAYNFCTTDPQGQICQMGAYRGPKNGLSDNPGIDHYLQRLADTQPVRHEQHDNLNITIWPDYQASEQPAPPPNAKKPHWIFRIPILGRLLRWLFGK